MDLSYPSLFACTVSLTIFVLILYMILHKNAILSHLGIISIYIFSLLTLLRGCLPFDFYALNITKTYPSYVIIPKLQVLMESPISSQRSDSLSVIELLMLIWGSVGLILLVKKSIGYIRYRKKIHAIVYQPSENTKRIYTAAFRKIFPNKLSHYKILKLRTLSTPATFGIIHPVILLPDIAYTDEELYYVFLHELLHIKHRHYLQQLIMDMIISIHWWNLIVLYLFPPVIRQIQELFVDISVTKLSTKSDKANYLQCLLRTLKYSAEHETESSHTYYALCDSSSERNLHQRFYLIAQSKTKNVSVLFFIAILFAFYMSFSVVFEAVVKPQYDEHGHEVFYFTEDNSYFIQNGTKYDLYLDGEFFYSFDSPQNAPSDFRNLPIYDTTLNKLKEFD